MIGRTTGRTWFDTLESKHFEIEFIDERLNDSDRIILAADIVIEPFGEQGALGSKSYHLQRNASWICRICCTYDQYTIISRFFTTCRVVIGHCCNERVLRLV